jgi:hypothetical protein
MLLRAAHLDTPRKLKARSRCGGGESSPYARGRGRATGVAECDVSGYSELSTLRSADSMVFVESMEAT